MLDGTLAESPLPHVAPKSPTHFEPFHLATDQRGCGLNSDEDPFASHLPRFLGRGLSPSVRIEHQRGSGLKCLMPSLWEAWRWVRK